MNNNRFKLLIACILSLMLVLSGCSSETAAPAGGGGTTVGDTSDTVGDVGTGDGTETGVINDDGIDTGIAATATTVAGKVTLSSIVSSKARRAAAQKTAIRKGKPGSAAYNKAMSLALQQQKAMDSSVFPGRRYSGDAFALGDVYLYNSSRPEWSFPVAKATTDANGIYTLSTLTNSANNGSAYTDGDPIPGGNYTILAWTKRGLFPDLVALQSVVSEFAGDISGVNLEAARSTASPTVTSMLGVAKNTDGTQTWGSSSLVLAPNAAVQVAFSMPMFRELITSDYLELKSTDGGTVPAGVWTLSADWLTATYYLNDGEFWTPGKTYTVRAIGSDSEFGTTGGLYNVYARFLEKTGTGTFKIFELQEGQTVEEAKDTVGPNAILTSPAGQTDVEVITPIRFVSDEVIDVNGVRLKSVDGSPSLGAQPSVLFVGPVVHPISGGDGFEYEFVLGEPLKLGESYKLEISGGTDLAGNVMGVLNKNFGTESTSEGIAVLDENLEGEALEIAKKSIDNQSAVKDVFGQWVRGFNDRNIPQVQGLMTPEFLMGYNTAEGFRETDKNRDGALDLDEFSQMLTDSFLNWDYCKITMVGSIVGDINVTLPVLDGTTGDVVIPPNADFAFKLIAESEEQSPTCKQAAVDQELFANLLKINGKWKIERASEGVDNREKEVVVAQTVNLVQPDDGAEPSFGDENGEKDVVFEWSEFVDSSADQITTASYIWIVFDDRDPTSGMAFIVPSSITSLNVPSDLDSLVEQEIIANVTSDFKFTKRFNPRDGAVLNWQVAALKGNTVDDVNKNRETSLPDSIIAMSELRQFSIPGEFEELDFTVASNSSDLATFKERKQEGLPYEDRLNGVDGTVAMFNEFIGGFDVGEADFATISIISPNLEPHFGFIEVNGNTRIEKRVRIENGSGSFTVALNNGTNNVMIADGVPCWFDPEDNIDCKDGEDDINGIRENFNIETLGGIRPVISLDAAVDADEDGTFESSGIVTLDANDTETILQDNPWNWYESNDAVALKVSGNIDFSVGALGGQKPETVNVRLGNAEGASAKLQATVDQTTGNFNFQIEVFPGENWIDIMTNVCQVETDENGRCDYWNMREFRVFLGMVTEAGAEFTAPFNSLVVTDGVDDSIVIPQGDNWGEGGRWNATAATSNSVTITGVLEFASDATDASLKPRYNIGSEGGWQEGQLPVNLDGSFELSVDLFNGENWLNIQDVSGNNYNMSIFTDGGKEVIRPEITQINGTDFIDSRELFSTEECSVTIDGTAQEGEIFAIWEAEDQLDNGMRQWYREEANTEAVIEAGATDATFSVTLPLVGSPAGKENRININDKAFNGMWLNVISTGDCSYTSPKIAVTMVLDDESNELSEQWSDGNRAQYGAAGSGGVFGKPFPGSVGLEVSSPVDDAINLGAGTPLLGRLDPSVFAADSAGIRVVVKEPGPNEGMPVLFLTSKSDDPMLDMFSGAPEGTVGTVTFQASETTLDNVDATLNLDPERQYIIEVLAWKDMYAVDSNGEALDPDAGYQIPVNGAVLPEFGECNSAVEDCGPSACDPSQGVCDDNTGGGECMDCAPPPSCDPSQGPCDDSVGVGAGGEGECMDCAPPPSCDPSQGPCDDSVGVGTGGEGECMDCAPPPSCDPSQGPCDSGPPGDGNCVDCPPGDGGQVDDNCMDCGGVGGQEVTTDSVTIQGTSTVANRTVFVEVESCGGQVEYTTTSEAISSSENVDGEALYAWSAPGVLVYDGQNRIRAHLGNRYDFEQSFEVELRANSQTPDPAPVMQIDGISGTMIDGTDETAVTVSEVEEPNPLPCGQSRWDAGAADTVMVTLTTTGPDVGGEWRTEGANGFYQFVNGTVDIALPNLFTGENRFEFWDWDGNSLEVWIETTGGSDRPEYVSFTVEGEALGDNLAPGDQVVEVIIQGDPAGTGESFDPKEFGMEVWIDGRNYMYVNQPFMLNGQRGEVVDLMPVLDSSNVPTGNFSFTIVLEVPADTGDSSRGVSVGFYGWLNGEVGGSAENPGRWVFYNFDKELNNN